jgi:uncharacterized protein
MSEKNKIEIAEKFVKDKVAGYDSGHDWWHITRVRKLALYINSMENLENPLLVDLAALFHDFADSKFEGSNQAAGFEAVARFMNDNGLGAYSHSIINVMQEVSFSSRKEDHGMKNNLLRIIQDADRLDAIGAIGIARAFNYGGYRNNLIYSPVEEENRNSTIKHFYEKLLLLSSMMNTETARILARERHEFLELFLKQFYREWNSDSF